MKSNPIVLYVEDDAPSRAILQVLLVETLGIEHFNVFEDSKDIISKTEALDPQPSIIFLDIHMQPIDGFEMLKLFRNHPIFMDLPIIALTASVMNEEVDKLRQAGFSGVVAKPIKLETFAKTLNKILDGEEVWFVI